MKIEMSSFPHVIAAMSDTDLECFIGCARREEEVLMCQLRALQNNITAFNIERNKRRIKRGESLQRNG